MPSRWPSPADAELDRFDPVAARAASRFFEVLGRYHRVDVRGLERIPDGPCILVGNHNGGVYPVDGLFLVHYYRRFGFDRPIFVLTHDVMFKLRPLGRLIERVGMIRASGAAARRVLERGDKLLVFPGGDLDTLRPFKRRREVFLGGHAGFARLAVSAGVPVVPVASAGSHETLIVLNQGRRLARMLGLRAFARIDSFPLALCLPWGLVFGPGVGLPYWPLPAKVTVEVGEPIPPGRLQAAPAEGADPVERLYRRTETELQRILNELYGERLLPVLG